MHPERLQFLNLRHPPARLTAEEAAWYLGFMPHDIAALISAKMLKPLGTPAQNSTKYFLAKRLTELRDDDVWMHKASDIILKTWRLRNRLYAGKHRDPDATGKPPTRQKNSGRSYSAL